MRILIVGAGNAGRYLAAKLSEERHDIVVVDRDESALTELSSQLDIQAVAGEGSSPRVLDRAGLSQTDLLVAVTDRDEVNILACLFANAAGVRHKVARVSNPDLTHTRAKFDLRRMGIDLVISQKEECADEIFTILRMPGTLEAVDLFENRVLAVGFKIHMDSPLILQTLKNFPRPDLLQRIRMMALMRANELMIPRGDTQLMIGDELYLCGTPDDVNAFLEWAHPEHKRFEKVVIAGGGDLGLQIALRLEKADMPVVLIERDAERAQFCSQALDKALVIKGNALEQETLENAGVVRGSAFVAATGSDENNIIICLLAEKAGAAFTLAQVTRPEYVPIIGSLSLLDRAVSAHMSMINSILHFVRGKNVKAAAMLHNLPGELLDVVIAPGHRWADKPIRALKVPEDIVIATVLRGENVLPPTGDLVLRIQDRLVLFALPSGVERVEDLFRG
ncbi:MAG: Trk system potassium transporter TrkA [Kiritimatiellae bacterium]|nr:Trk system potassium transporter TrkA [Kiritimatiellia bacterium]MDW8459129.1 Trk system potassium transporter TrkA [Verrucomicrobiota bacterium]